MTPKFVAVSTEMLSVPTPYRPITTQFFAALTTFSVTLAKQVKIPSTSFERFIKVFSLGSGATITSALI